MVNGLIVSKCRTIVESIEKEFRNRDIEDFTEKELKNKIDLLLKIVRDEKPGSTTKIKACELLSKIMVSRVDGNSYIARRALFESGFTIFEWLENLNRIANQDRDIGAALRALKMQAIVMGLPEFNDKVAKIDNSRKMVVININSDDADLKEAERRALKFARQSMVDKE